MRRILETKEKRGYEGGRYTFRGKRRRDGRKR